MTKIRGISALLLTLGMGAVAQAQDDVITIVQSLTASVKPGMEAQFEEVVRAFRDVSREQSVGNYWRASQSVSGEPVYRFNFALSSWGDLMNPEPNFAEAYGEEEAARLMGLLSTSLASSHVAFYEQRASMSRPPMNLEGPPEALVFIDFTLNPGTAAQFREMSTKVAEASAAVAPGDFFVGAMPGFGASGPRTILILPSMSDLDTPAPGPGQLVLQHFGQEEGARINALAGESIANFNATLFRTRPDLTYLPED